MIFNYLNEFNNNIAKPINTRVKLGYTKNTEPN